jgi:hypothetical protein
MVALNKLAHSNWTEGTQIDRGVLAELACQMTCVKQDPIERANHLKCLQRAEIKINSIQAVVSLILRDKSDAITLF